RQQQNQIQGGGGEADDNGGEHQRLGHRVGEQSGINRFVEGQGRPVHRQAAHDEDEHVHCIGDKQQSDDHLKGTWPQDKPHPGGEQYADGYGNDSFHQFSSLPVFIAASTAS